jgi:hypothetical protein
LDEKQKGERASKHLADSLLTRLCQLHIHTFIAYLKKSSLPRRCQHTKGIVRRESIEMCKVATAGLRADSYASSFQMKHSGFF